jgi:hypothetical protein
MKPSHTYERITKYFTTIYTLPALYKRTITAINVHAISKPPGPPVQGRTPRAKMLKS